MTPLRGQGAATQEDTFVSYTLCACAHSSTPFGELLSPSVDLGDRKLLYLVSLEEALTPHYSPGAP